MTGSEIGAGTLKAEKLLMDPRLIRMPEDHWGPSVSFHQAGSYVRIEQAIGPEGFLTRLICTGCARKRAVLMRPAARVHAMGPAIRAITRSRAVMPHVDGWVDRHGECRNAGRPVVIPEPYAGYVERLRRRADNHGAKDRYASPVLMATRESGDPLLFDAREVFELPDGQRYKRGFQLVAALRDRMRHDNGTFTSVLFYRGGPSGSGLPAAMIDIETPHGRYSGEAELVGQTTGSGPVEGRQGRFSFGVGNSSSVFDDVFVTEKRLIV